MLDLGRNSNNQLFIRLNAADNIAIAAELLEEGVITRDYLSGWL